MTTLEINENKSTPTAISARVVLATLFAVIPPIVFEKYTYQLYLTGSPNFFTFSGDRIWFDIIWFGAAGAITAFFIVGRDRRASIIPPLVASLFFVFSGYVVPLCAPKECYVSSTDGLAPLRDFLLLTSLGVITSAASLKSWGKGKHTDRLFQFCVTALVGYALTFYPIMHIFAGVSVPFPGNYLQWFLAGAPAGLASSMWLVDRGTGLKSPIVIFFAGISGVLLNLALAVDLPCEACSGYPVSIISIILLSALFTIPAIVVFVFRRSRLLSESTTTKSPSPISKALRLGPGIVTSVTIVVAIILMWSFFLAANYQMSVVNGFSGVSNSRFSPLEVGREFVYAAGFLAAPRITPKAVGVSLSFGNSTINQAKFPDNFLAAGIGDQSPNCCKDGLDLAYRADAIEFSNGTEAVVARAWWACDVNIACGGYSWQQLLHIGIVKLPPGALAGWVDLEMNWTSNTLIQWFYRLGGGGSPWVLYSSFTPPKIQNHYWDAGLYFVGSGNQPTEYAYFSQFGVSSATPISAGSWNVTERCPDYLIDGSWVCAPKAGFISGQHSFWKVLYTFGEDYPGVGFSYLGNYTVSFFYSGGKIPRDNATIWS